MLIFTTLFPISTRFGPIYQSIGRNISEIRALMGQLIPAIQAGRSRRVARICLRRRPRRYATYNKTRSTLGKRRSGFSIAPMKSRVCIIQIWRRPWHRRSINGRRRNGWPRMRDCARQLWCPAKYRRWRRKRLIVGVVIPALCRCSCLCVPNSPTATATIGRFMRRRYVTTW